MARIRAPRCARGGTPALIVSLLVLALVAAVPGALPGVAGQGEPQRPAAHATASVHEASGSPPPDKPPSVRAAASGRTPPAELLPTPGPAAAPTPSGRPPSLDRSAPASPAVAPALGAGSTARAAAVPRVAGGHRLPGQWPDAVTTGVPAGTSLRASGPLDITENGTVIEALDIDGCVTVRAADVVIRASRITCPSSDGRGAVPVRTRAGAHGLLVEDVEIDGRGKASVAVCCTDYTLRRVEIHSVVDGPRLSDRTAVVESWVHSLARVQGSHNDTLQTTGGRSIVVRGNSLQAWQPRSGDPMNAVFMVGSETAPAVADLLFEGNLLNGGNYTVNVRKDTAASNIVFRRNVFGRDCRYGAVTGLVGGVTWDVTNVWEDDGTPVAHSGDAEPASPRCSRRGA